MRELSVSDGKKVKGLTKPRFELVLKSQDHILYQNAYDYKLSQPPRIVIYQHLIKLKMSKSYDPISV